METHMDKTTSEKRQLMNPNASLKLGLVTVAFAAGMISPLAAGETDNWGESYDNGSGMTVCMCHDKLEECAPCFTIPPGEDL
jgi:hypothetical protein